MKQNCRCYYIKIFFQTMVFICCCLSFYLSFFAIMEYLCTAAGLCVAHLIWLNNFMWRDFFHSLLLLLLLLLCVCPFFSAAQIFIVWNNLWKFFSNCSLFVCICASEHKKNIDICMFCVWVYVCVCVFEFSVFNFSPML